MESEFKTRPDQPAYEGHDLKQARSTLVDDLGSGQIVCHERDCMSQPVLPPSYSSCYDRKDLKQSRRLSEPSYPMYLWRPGACQLLPAANRRKPNGAGCVRKNQWRFLVRRVNEHGNAIPFFEKHVPHEQVSLSICLQFDDGIHVLTKW